MRLYPIEWRYFAGRKTNGIHWHYVEFRKQDTYFRHWSVNGKFYEDDGELNDSLHIETPQFSYYFHPESRPIEHKMRGVEYFSWPKITDGITEAWYDHAKMHTVGSNWDWLGCNLDCGMTIMVWNREEDPYCDLTFNDVTMKVTCTVDGRHFFIPETGMYLIADDTQLNPPTTRNIVHKPKYGRPYSEWCFDVVSKGGIIGRGIREKTYKEVQS